MTASLSENPIAIFKDALSRAQKADIPLANAMSLATVSEQGQPSVRMVLLKGVTDIGFSFYCNLGSQKALDLKRNSKAALGFWWEPIKEQIRIEGRVQAVSKEEADKYFSTRPKDSQIGAWASNQSRSLKNQETLLKKFEDFKTKFGKNEIPRPEFWSGFLLIPHQIEFWYDRKARLHKRVLFTRTGSQWQKGLLNP